MSDVVRFVGMPTGPKIFVAELGSEQPTFVEEPGGKQPALTWHVPLNARGPFKPDQLANYDSSKQYRTDITGWLLCYEHVTDPNSGAKRYCKRKAINRFPRCTAHGGRIHPMDNVIDPTIEMAEPEPDSLSRYQQYLAKQIGIDDLDDDEVMNFGFRAKNGQIFKPKNITREMVQAFTKAIYERSLDSLRANALEAVKTLTTIMMDDQVDAPVRVKAATEILDRTLGKAPQTVQLVGDAPWEQVFQGIATVTREESRKQRGMIVDAEVVETNDSTESTSNPNNRPRNLMKELEQLGDSDG